MPPWSPPPPPNSKSDQEQYYDYTPWLMNVPRQT